MRNEQFGFPLAAAELRDLERRCRRTTMPGETA
jgi:hypothetical protein